MIQIRNPMQHGSYNLTAKAGQLDPSFKPAFTPAQMLRLGVFEGYYLNSARTEYPASWFTHARLSEDGPDSACNAFAVRSRMPLSHWEAQGWINPQDPRGWFEWYCRYYRGRRTDDDDRQIKRWRAFARHSAQVRIHGHRETHIRRVQRQALLQWTWDPFPDFGTPKLSVFDRTVKLLRN